MPPPSRGLCESPTRWPLHTVGLRVPPSSRGLGKAPGWASWELPSGTALCQDLDAQRRQAPPPPASSARAWGSDRPGGVRDGWADGPGACVEAAVLRAAGFLSRAPQGASPSAQVPGGFWARASHRWPLLPRRLQGALKPGRGGGAAGEGVCVPGGLLQTQVPRAAREVSRGHGPARTSASRAQPARPGKTPTSRQGTSVRVRRPCSSWVAGSLGGEHLACSERGRGPSAHTLSCASL